MNRTFPLTNLCFSLFSSGLRYVFNLPCLDTTLFLLEWAWITPNIPYFLANGFHLEIRKSLQEIENREYSTQKRINQNAYAFNVVFYGVIWRLDHNKGIRGEYFGVRWEKVNQKIEQILWITTCWDVARRMPTEGLRRMWDCNSSLLCLHWSPRIRK